MVKRDTLDRCKNLTGRVRVSLLPLHRPIFTANVKKAFYRLT